MINYEDMFPEDNAVEERLRADIAELVEVLKDLNGYHLGVPYPLADRVKELIAKHEARAAAE